VVSVSGKQAGIPALMSDRFLPGSHIFDRCDIMPHQPVLKSWLRCFMIFNISTLIISNALEWRTVMSDFVEQLRLAEKAAEDIYFAKVSRELIENLHKRIEAEKDSRQASDQSGADAQAKTSPDGRK
jgi:hypothetical protein